MKFVVLVCNDGIPASDAEEELVGRAISDHIAAIAGLEVYGHPLEGPHTARTVRVRDGETLVTDGPFVEAKEHIAGFAVLECESREQAIAAAATHPLAWFHKVEVRAFAEDDWTAEVRERLQQGPDDGRQRYMLLICSDGIPASAKAEAMSRELPRWVERTAADGSLVAGGRLEPPVVAATVRVRGPHTLVTDGPFVETREFIAGFDVIDCADVDEAIAIAAAHPVSWFHAIEVRPFTLWTCDVPAADRGRAALTADPAR